MADLASTAVVVIESWTTGGTNGRRNKVKKVKWSNTTAGGLSNKLLASALGFTKVLRCSDVFLDASTKKSFPAVPSPDGTTIYTLDVTNATDATRATPADVATSTDFAYCTVEGV